MLIDTSNSPHASAHPLPAGAVQPEKGLWKSAQDLCAGVTVPHLQSMFEAKDISHVLENFRICAKDSAGSHAGTVFGDGDFYKWMEAATYSASRTNDTALLEKLDEYIDLIARAQLEDGYISTKQIIGEREGACSRLSDVNDFEVYNFGHLFTSACLHHRLTGKRNFLGVAVKAAGYLEKLYNDAKATGSVQTAVCPSHYMGLVELYRTTGDKRFLQLASLAVELRDGVKNGTDDNQDRLPLREHTAIIGHAVRANYLYAGVADLCAETGDKELLAVLDKMWESLTRHKLYITGGCGALYNGVSPYGNFFKDQKTHQAYGYEYQLPNITAYNETCAAIGCVMWAHRMFMLRQKAEYYDVIERVMLNTCLAAVSLEGNKYFYQNALRREKKLEYELVWPLTRSEYILSYCCPPNLARCIAQADEYAYSVSGDTVWLGMYMAGKAEIKLENGAEFTLVQKTDYPWDGAIEFAFEAVKQEAPVRLMLRLPGWMQSGSVLYNGVKRGVTEEDAGDYFEVKLDRPEGKVLLELDMPVRYTQANPMIEEDEGMLAVERGPLVYCLEGRDADAPDINMLMYDANAEYSLKKLTLCGRDMLALEGEAVCFERDTRSLYQTFKPNPPVKKCVRLIPYFAWDNRGMDQMRVWLPAYFGR